MEAKRGLVICWGSHSQEAEKLGFEPRQSGWLLRPCPCLLPENI